MKKIGDYIEIGIYGGQIMSRVAADAKASDDEKIKVNVLVPKAITANGTITVEDLAVEDLKAMPDSSRVTMEGDIVIKLSTPYDSAIVTSETEGCVVPSFCAIIRNRSEIPTEYLQAYLSSKLCKDQLRAKVAGTTMSILSVGKIRDLDIPVPDHLTMREIGDRYVAVQKRITTLKKIVELEEKRNDVVFYNIARE